LASTPLTPETKDTIDKLGPVKYICGPDTVHWLYLKEFKDAYPDAKLYSQEEVVKKKVDKSLKFEGVWAGSEGPTSFADGEIQACHFTGWKAKDVVFFHPASKTIIEADLLINLPGTEQYSKTKGGGKGFIANQMNPGSKIYSLLINGQVADKEAMKRDAKTVAGWDFERIIPCHGDVIENDGKKAWQTLYKDYLA